MGPASSFNHLSDGLQGPHATATTGWQHQTIRPAIQLRRIETDQIEIEALVAQPSQILLNQGTRNNPLATRVETASFGRSDQPNPARRTKKHARPSLHRIY